MLVLVGPKRRRFRDSLPPAPACFWLLVLIRPTNTPVVCALLAVTPVYSRRYLMLFYLCSVRWRWAGCGAQGLVLPQGRVAGSTGGQEGGAHRQGAQAAVRPGGGGAGAAGDAAGELSARGGSWRWVVGVTGGGYGHKTVACMVCSCVCAVVKEASAMPGLFLRCRFAEEEAGGGAQSPSFSFAGEGAASLCSCACWAERERLRYRPLGQKVLWTASLSPSSCR